MLTGQNGAPVGTVVDFRRRYWAPYVFCRLQTFIPAAEIMGRGLHPGGRLGYSMEQASSGTAPKEGTFPNRILLNGTI